MTVTRNVLIHILSPFLCLTLLSGCGGGGGGGSASADAYEPFAVFFADKDSDGVTELYVTNQAGDDIHKLSGPMVAGGNVRSALVSPDGQYVAYIADQDTDTMDELYVADADGSDWRKVSDTLPAGGRVGNMRWAPDSSRLVYNATQDDAAVLELYTVRPDGSGNVKVSGAMVADGNVSQTQFFWAPDSSRLAYIADQDTNGVDELYTVFPDGTGNLKVSSALVAGGDVGVNTIGPTLLYWAPDSSRILYIADGDTDGIAEIYTALPDIAASGVKVSGAMVAGGEVDFRFEWAPDASSIAYVADQDTDGVNELYLAAPDGSGDMKVSGAMVAGGEVSTFAWSPTGAYLAYLADQDTDGVRELYVTDAAGAAVKVSGPMVAGGQVMFDYAWSADGSLIAYRADQDTDETIELYTSTPDALENDKVSGPMVAGGGLGDRFTFSTFVWAPNGGRIAYVADQQTDGVFELFVVETEGGGGWMKVSGAMPTNGDVDVASFNGSAVAWRGSRLVYRADQETNTTLELFSVRANGDDHHKISGVMGVDGDVSRFLVID